VRNDKEELYTSAPYEKEDDAYKQNMNQVVPELEGNSGNSENKATIEGSRPSSMRLLASGHKTFFFVGSSKKSNSSCVPSNVNKHDFCVGAMRGSCAKKLQTS